MKKKLTNTTKTPTDSLENNADIMSQIGKIKKKLDILGKKIDSLLIQSTPHQSRRNNFTPRKFSNHNKENKNYNDTNNTPTQITCSLCHKESTIPFKPTGNGPIYCRDCFSKQQDNSSKNKRFDKPKKGNFNHKRKRPIR